MGHQTVQKVNGRKQGTFFLLHRFFAKFCFYDRGKATPEVIEVQQGDYLSEDKFKLENAKNNFVKI